MRFILKLLVTSLAVFFAAYILEGVYLKGFPTAILVAFVIAFLNAFLRPILVNTYDSIYFAHIWTVPPCYKCNNHSHY
jgi:uncharacterized membrane protein YvlD (DUF360 family)